MWPEVVVWVKKRVRSSKTKSLPLCHCPKKTGSQKQWRVLATFLPPHSPTLSSSTRGGKSPSGRSSDQSRSFFSGHHDAGETQVKGQAKHLEKPKSSLSLTTGRPFITSARFQIHLPSEASLHLHNSMTHPCLLPRHSENKRAN